MQRQSCARSQGVQSMRRLIPALLALTLATPAWAQSTLTIALREDPDVLDPTLGSSYVGRIVYAAMCDKLIDIDEKLNFVPQLATSWQYDDPTHLVLHLRPNVVFHDGEKFDAEAVKYKLTRDQTMKGSMRVGEVNMIGSVEVIDPLTVRLVLKTPSAPLISLLADQPPGGQHRPLGADPADGCGHGAQRRAEARDRRGAGLHRHQHQPGERPGG